MYLNGICFITDRTVTAMPVYDMVSSVLDAGITFIQYREKSASRLDIYKEAACLRELTHRYAAILIINDHADIALAVDADGVHLGQDDLSLAAARKIMEGRIVGISTHSIEQAQAASETGADYIGFGPIFHTTTKEAGAPKGVDIIRTIKQNVHIPVVAIGGINHANLFDIIGAGADAAAVATAICRGNIAQNSKKFVQIINSIREVK